MQAWVVYDSFFGNTEKVAQAIGNTLGLEGEVSVYRVNQVPGELPEGLALLVVGSPTRQFHHTAAIRDFIKGLPESMMQRIRVAAFDTRIDVRDIDSAIGRFFVGRFGYAAKRIADELLKRGGKLATQPEGFFVADTEGPLKDGEIERAKSWAKTLQRK